MSKDLWISELEKIGEDYASGSCDEEHARSRLRGLGMYPEEIDEHIWALNWEMGDE